MSIAGFGAGFGAGEDRYQSIDAVRGFAVLGILLMNIVGMGLPSYAYVDPHYYGGAEGANYWTWAVNFVFSDGKMRSLFTMLFGASMILIITRAERPGAPMRPAALHYRRMVWLLVFGIVHALFLWFGDILVTYALAGCIAFLFRRLKPGALLTIGAALLLVTIGIEIAFSQNILTLRAAAEAPRATPAAIAAYHAAFDQIAPRAGALQAELAGYRGSFMDAVRVRAPMAIFLDTVVLIFGGDLGEAVGQMLIGMGLFQLGFFTARMSTRVYLALIALGYGVAAPVTGWIAGRITASHFELAQAQVWAAWSAIPRPFVALAHGSLILLMVKAGALKPLTNRLAAAGRMAFSNYLGTSIFTAFVFCGFGLGLYGHLQRWQLYGVVLAAWVLMLAWSKPWIERFHYGPFEWAWRSLVFLKPQPFIRRPSDQPAEAAT